MEESEPGAERLWSATSCSQLIQPIEVSLVSMTRLQRELQKVCQIDWSMSCVAQAHFSTHIDPTSVSFGLINLFQHHTHLLCLDLRSWGISHICQSKGPWGASG